MSSLRPSNLGSRARRRSQLAEIRLLLPDQRQCPQTSGTGSAVTGPRGGVGPWNPPSSGPEEGPLRQTSRSPGQAAIGLPVLGTDWLPPLTPTTPTVNQNQGSRDSRRMISGRLQSGGKAQVKTTPTVNNHQTPWNRVNHTAAPTPGAKAVPRPRTCAPAR